MHKPHKHPFASFIGLFCVLFLVLLFTLWNDVVGGNALHAADARPTPTPTQPVSSLPTPKAYPTPHLTPAPLDTLVRVENVRAVPQALVPVPNYTTRQFYVEDSDFPHDTLYVDDPATGRSVQIGDDIGSARLRTTYPEQLLWQYYCDPCPTLKPGIYLYDIKASTNTLVLPASTHAIFPKLDNNWLVYVRSMNLFSPHYIPRLPLIAYDLATQQEITLTEELWSPLANPGTFAVGSGIAVWNEWGDTLMMHDFATGETSSVLPEGGPTDIGSLTVNDGVITWLAEGSYQGFDLATGSHFRIPYDTPGWVYGDVLDQVPVRAQGNRLVWGLKSTDQVWHYYEADLVRDAAATPVP